MSGADSLDYRADVDGLRAIAVLAVVVFHAFPQWLPGGFIGVDVFFVISGFLISSIILKAHAKATFSYADFYARRIRRIFPALVLVLAACLVLGWLVLTPDYYAELGRHAVAGSLFIANLALWREAGYFDHDAQLKPLMHLSHLFLPSTAVGAFDTTNEGNHRAREAADAAYERPHEAGSVATARQRRRGRGVRFSD